jgi:hypothetical protein
MKWLKQTFAVRYNVLMGRIGHIWGDRYWSLILEGEPPEREEDVGMEGGEEAEGEPLAMTRAGGRPQHGKITRITEFSLIFPHPLATAPP